LPIPETDRKLREAAFFLRLLTIEEGSTVLNDHDAFGFYLSAFLSAARSVTWVLQKEAGVGQDIYDPWYTAWEARQSPDHRDLLTFMNKQRVAEIHKLGATTTSAIEMVAVSTVSRGARPNHPAYGFTWSSPPGVPEATVGIVTYMFEQRGNVVQVCSRYLGVLVELVRDFRDSPPRPKPPAATATRGGP